MSMCGSEKASTLASALFILWIPDTSHKITHSEQKPFFKYKGTFEDLNAFPLLTHAPVLPSH